MINVTEEKLHAIARQVIALVMQKNADYGDAWQRQGINGCLVRLADKLYRIDNLVGGHEALIQGEALQDTLVDAIGYAMLGLLYLKEHESIPLACGGNPVDGLCISCSKFPSCVDFNE